MALIVIVLGTLNDTCLVNIPSSAALFTVFETHLESPTYIKYV